MTGPKRAPVVSGTGGLRKIRIAPEGWSKGKSGAARVCYVYFEASCLVLLLAAYGKNEKGNLKAAEKRQIKQLIEEIEGFEKR